MGIRIGAIFLMITLVAGFTSFPSSLSNYSTEIVDQPNSLNLINTAFADSHNGKGDDKEKGKPDDVGKNKEKQAKNNEGNIQVFGDDVVVLSSSTTSVEDNEDHEDNDIQEFGDDVVVLTSSTTSVGKVTICHLHQAPHQLER